MTTASCHDTGTGHPTLVDAHRFALVGSPNSGKTTLFNALTGLRAKTGNYPGVTVSRYEGVTKLAVQKVVVEDLPGTYSLDPISPDEQVVSDVLDPELDEFVTPEALLITADATTLKRSLAVVAQALSAGLPACVVVTFYDELMRRGGSLDVPALSRALGVPVVIVTGGNAGELEHLRTLMGDVAHWSRPPLLPPLETEAFVGWRDSVLHTAGYASPDRDARTARLDKVLLHPVAGTIVFFLLMFGFFQVLFTLAAPLQDAVEGLFVWLGDLCAEHIDGTFGRFINEAVINGVGAVAVFLPQIALLFLMISILEGSGYMSRAAMLMDRVMSRFGLDGRAFVALLSSLACAIPGIMATRSLPSARDRIATIMGAPLMTCSARLPVYVMLIAMLVPDTHFGPVSLQGLVMFGLYFLGALAAMLTAWLFGTIIGRKAKGLPFYMEMPPYRVPKLRSVALSVWDSCLAFLKRVSGIILVTTIALWVALNLPLHDDATMAAAGVDLTDDVAVTSYELENSYAAGVGKAIEPVFEPLGFDWRINIGVISSTAAREVFVATLGQIAAAEDPDNPEDALAQMTRANGEPLFTPGTTAAMLMFFVFALQCFATLGAIRRETGGWKWSMIAFGYMFALAWVFGAGANLIVTAVVG